jgi:hypothetical protein
MKTLVAMFFVLSASCVSAADTDDFVTCMVEDTYNTGQTPCYVDSVNGNDANNGLSEAFPVKSQSAINSRCTVVRFKRGSVFNEKLAIPTPFNRIRFGYNVKVYTNYGPESDPLPQFKVSHEPGRGPVVISFSPLTIDGLHFSGARGDNTMVHDFDFDGDGITKGIVGGIGAFLGAATTFINNEIDDCDIGLMLGGEGSVVRGNYVHDLIMGIDDAPGVDPNLVGGAEGIFINASNSDVSYNSFINCSGPARWVGNNGTCDGGATEVSLASGATIKNVHVHHNFSYNSCGFLEIAAYFGDQGKGLFKDSTFHNNVIVDSAWMALLQVNNTNFENVHFYNNTLIQHPGSLNAGILWIIFTAVSSGMEGGALVPGTVHLTNNLYVLDGVTSWFRLIDPAFDTKNNIVASYWGRQDPNYIDLGFANIAGTTASDFKLVKAGSPAVNTGADIAGNTLDFFNRARPLGNAPDIGALEFGSYQAKCLPRFPTASKIYPFLDVPLTHWAASYIKASYTAHITTGYGGTDQFKPEYEVSRDQMAAFIIRAKEGEPAADYCNTGSYFADVSVSGWACKYIKRLYEVGVTTGYGGTNLYRPELTVTRDQMAAFIIRAKEGEPAPAYCDSGSPFIDVAPSSWSCRYIKRLYELGITTGYEGTNQYRPDLPVTRAQMAAFIGRAFLGMQ